MVHVNSTESGKGFLLLTKSGPSEAMKIDYDLGPSPTDLYMADAGGLKLKWARSPPRLAFSLEIAWDSDFALCWEGDIDLSDEHRKAGSRGKSSPVISEGGSSLSLVSRVVSTCTVAREG